MAGLFAGAVLVGLGCDNTDDRHEFFDPDGDLYTEKYTCNQTFTGQPVTCPDLQRSRPDSVQQDGDEHL